MTDLARRPDDDVPFAEPWPEGLPEGRIERVPCYTVRFRSTDLWGPTAENFTVTVDLVEPYLEEIGSP